LPHCCTEQVPDDHRSREFVKMAIANHDVSSEIKAGKIVQRALMMVRRGERVRISQHACKFLVR
jgi:hypothetical protein